VVKKNGTDPAILKFTEQEQYASPVVVLNIRKGK
jgi:hypothetical protein